MARPVKKKVLRSSFEDKIAKSLLDKGIDFGYEAVKMQYTVEHSYTLDFILPNGVMIETKGYFTPADRSKHLALKAQFPALEVRFVFMRATSKLHKNSPTTYAEWAEKHGFMWADKEIPESWIQEVKKTVNLSDMAGIKLKRKKKNDLQV